MRSVTCGVVATKLAIPSSGLCLSLSTHRWAAQICESTASAYKGVYAINQPDGGSCCKRYVQLRIFRRTQLPFVAPTKKTYHTKSENSAGTQQNQKEDGPVMSLYSPMTRFFDLRDGLKKNCCLTLPSRGTALGGVCFAVRNKRCAPPPTHIGRQHSYDGVAVVITEVKVNLDMTSMAFTTLRP